MSIATAIQNAQNKIVNCYTAIANKGGTLPATQDLANMPDAIDSISGGGGGGGFTLEYQYTHDGGDHMGVVLNDSTITSQLFSRQDQMRNVYAILNIPNIQTLQVTGDNDYYSDCIVEFTSGGTTRSLSFGETVTLTQDSKIKLYEADCLLKGTIITMADGSIKEISSVEVGDKILSINPETGEKEEDEVIYSDGKEKKYNDNYDLWEFENNYEVRTTHHHRFYNIERQAFVYLDEFNIGEHTISSKGEQIALLKHTNMEKQVHHFTIATKKWNIYFANNLVCGNRNSTEIHLGTEEQKKITSSPSESIGTFLEP